MSTKEYRGWKITRVEATQIGYASPVHNRQTHTLRERARKLNGWELTRPNGSLKWCDTLEEAREYIDNYEGTDG